jgi:PKD repeat protein
VNGTHTYTQTELETVKVKLTDDAPGTATATATSLILAVDPPPHSAASTVGNWLNAPTPMLATSFLTPRSESQLGWNGQANLLYQDTGGGSVQPGAPTQSGPPSLGDQHPFLGADGGADLLARGDSSLSGSLHGAFATK